MKKRAVFLIIVSITVWLAFNKTMAQEPLAFDTLPLKWHPKLQAVLPKTQWADRFYIQSNFKPSIINTQAVIDGKTLVRPVGNSQTSFMPPTLAEGYTTHYTDVVAFPISPFKQAQHQIVIGYELDGGKKIQVTLTHQRLAEFLSKLP